MNHEMLLRHAAIVQKYLDGVRPDAMGVPAPTVYCILRRYKVPKYCRPHRDPTPERTADMERRYRVGETLEQIGAAHGLTRERVRQILAKHRGLTAADGGLFVRSLLRVGAERAKRARRNAMKYAKWGMSAEEYDAHVSAYGCTSNRGSPMHTYMHQRKNARSRGIEWGFNFKDWWRLWQESGHWADRGKGRYCMARIGDSGPYAVGNVEIITQSQNSRDSFLIHPAADRAIKARATRLAKAQQPEQLAA